MLIVTKIMLIDFYIKKLVYRHKKSYDHYQSHVYLKKKKRVAMNTEVRFIVMKIILMITKVVH